MKSLRISADLTRRVMWAGQTFLPAQRVAPRSSPARITMKRLTALLFAVATLAGVAAFTMREPRHAAAQQAAPVFVTEIPSGYRDWRLISVAHEEGDLHSFAAVLGNDVAIKAYRDGTLPFPDGTIIAALHYRHAPSEENNKIFGRDQSFIAGSPTNIQFEVKDSKKYAATGGWGLVTSKMANRRLTRRSWTPASPATNRSKRETSSSRFTRHKADMRSNIL